MVKVSEHVRLKNPQNFQTLFNQVAKSNIFTLDIVNRTEEKEIVAWCNEHLTPDGVLFYRGHIEAYDALEDDHPWLRNYRIIASMDDQDAIMFKLTWLS